jgi:heme/copper-type cytochrome/quinol oxidase subunit 2
MRVLSSSPRRTLLRIAATAATLCAAGTLPVVSAGDAARVVEMTADKDNRWKLPDGKDVVTLKSGEAVRFKINSLFGGEKARDGAVHSFVVRKLREKGWSVRLKEGVQEFTLTAPPPGNYLIECTVECGPGHDTMSIKMVVTK